jgi:hypothetical protein
MIDKTIQTYQDLIDAHLHQLMGMAKAHAETSAMLEAAKREIAELKQKYEQNNQ